MHEYTIPTRLMIVDDAEHVRRELATLLSLSPDMDVLGQAADGLQAIQDALRLRPDVILMDLELPGMDGIEAARRIKSLLPGCRVIALTIHDTQQARQECVQAGMDGFVVKGASLDALRNTIHQGGGWEKYQEGVAQ